MKINIKEIDLDECNKYGYNYLMTALHSNLKLSPEQWSYLIEYSPLDQESEDGWTALSIAMGNESIHNLLNEEQLTYLIYNSPKNSIHIYGGNALAYALRNSKLQLSQELYQELVSKTHIIARSQDDCSIYYSPFVIACFSESRVPEPILIQLMNDVLYSTETWDWNRLHPYTAQRNLNRILSKVWNLTQESEKFALIDYFKEHKLTQALNCQIVISFIQKQELTKLLSYEKLSPVSKL